MIRKIKRWWSWNKPILTTPSKQMRMLIEYSAKTDKAYDKITWAAVNPVIHDLEKLRANTWDQDKITKMQEWLKHNFEVKES